MKTATIIRLVVLAVLVARVYYWLSIVGGVLLGIGSIAVGASIQDKERALGANSQVVDAIGKTEWIKLITDLQIYSIVFGILWIISAIVAIVGLRKRKIWLLIQYAVYQIIAIQVYVAFAGMLDGKIYKALPQDNPDRNWVYSRSFLYSFIGTVISGLICTATGILYQDFKTQNGVIVELEKNETQSNTASPNNYS
jgi:hypothetical protein